MDKENNIEEVLAYLNNCKPVVPPIVPKEEVKLKQFWHCPNENGAKLLTMPNLPKPLHNLAPRTIFGASAWNKIRKKCYADADYHCEICGKDLHDSTAHAHELYSINYLKHESVFERVVCLCPLCHVMGIHSGRALTLYKKGVPYMTKQKLLDGAENAFTIINEYNCTHRSQEPLRAFSTFLDYAKQPEMHDEMERLIKKYDMQFYRISEKSWDKQNWSDWKLIIDGVPYYTPYPTREDWEKAMDKNNTSNAVNTSTLSYGETINKIFDELEKKS